MKKLAVSGCFLYNCRYDGKEYENEKLQNYLQSLIEQGYVLVPICPEQMGGLCTPRPKSEILNGKVLDEFGDDLTDYFNCGANQALKIMKTQKIDIAILKQKSPSCGLGKIYDGSFSEIVIEGNGITAQLLLDNNIKVYSEEDIEDLL